MPLNLNINAVHQSMTNGGSIPQPIRTAVTSNGLQIISNGTQSVVANGKNGIRHQEHNSKEQIKKLESISTSSEPPTKVIKLINSNGITLSMDKDSKLIPSGQLTLSQVVVSQIPLLTPTQTLRVIPAPNGVATIELSNSNGKMIDICSHF